MEENSAEVCDESQEEQVRDDGVRLPQDRIEHRIVRKDRRHMQRDGNPRSSHDATAVEAERSRRAAHRIDSSGMSGSLHRAR
jgi:hypothetical protein